MWDMIWIGFTWLRIGTLVRSCEHGSEPSLYFQKKKSVREFLSSLETGGLSRSCKLL
jgi:hypothetical protein